MGAVCSRQPVFMNQVAEKVYFSAIEHFQTTLPDGPKSPVFRAVQRRLAQQLRVVPAEAHTVPVDLSEIALTAEGVTAVCGLLGHESLVGSLNLSGCGLTEATVGELAQSLKATTTLKHLRLANNTLGAQALDGLLTTFATLADSLVTLDIAATGATDDFVNLLAQDLYCNQSLRELVLANNTAVTPAAVAVLHAALSVNVYIRHLDLSGIEGVSDEMHRRLEELTTRNDACGQVMGDLLVACTDWNNILEYRLSSMRANNDEDDKPAKPANEPTPWLTVGYAETKGVREHMEDEVVLIPSFFNGNALFGVFDGHGGSECSKYCARHFPLLLLSRLKGNSGDPEACLIGACEDLDRSIREFKVPNGSCALVSYVTKDSVYTCSVGDSRAVMGMGQKTLQASQPITPADPEEKARIEAAGGFVSEANRVNGVLAVSRAFGDVPLQPILLPKPEITTHKLTGPAMLTLACDGVWDVLTAEQVVVSSRRCKGPRKAARTICNGAFHQGSLDNITVICVLIRDASGSGQF